MSWKDKQLIGLSIKSPKELEWIISLGIVNMVEIKVEHFAYAGFPLYSYKDGHFYPNDENLKRLSFEMCDGLEAVQFHLPMGKGMHTRTEIGLNMGVASHREIFLRMFQMWEEIYRQHKVGSVLTFHPPLFLAKGKSLLSEREMILNAKIFLESLDEFRFSGSYQTKIGMENMSDPKILWGNVGYLPAHFKTMLKDTRTIGITVDTGHRRLAENFKVSEFMKLGFEPVNCHFHGNPGKIDPKSYDDDTHEFPHGKSAEAGENVEGYSTYIRYFRRHRTPVVLEISHLDRYKKNPDELIQNVERIKKDLE